MNVELTKKQLRSITRIKGLIRREEKDIFTIGKIISDIKFESGQKRLFYEALGIHARTGQRYQKIYNNVEVQRLIVLKKSNEAA